MKIVAPISTVCLHISIDKNRTGERFPTLHVKPDSKYYNKKDRYPSNLLETADFEFELFIKDLEKFIGFTICSWNCYYTLSISVEINDEQLIQLPEIRQKVVEFCSKHFE